MTDPPASAWRPRRPAVPRPRPRWRCARPCRPSTALVDDDGARRRRDPIRTRACLSSRSNVHVFGPPGRRTDPISYLIGSLPERDADRVRAKARPAERARPVADHAHVRDPPRRARVAHDRLGWTRRPARQHVRHAGRGAVPGRDVDRRSGRASGRGCSSGSARWCAPPRPTPARRPATARSRSSGSAPAGRRRCGSTAPRRATAAEPVGQRRPASTPSGARRSASRRRRPGSDD